jgi:outer membrane protein assembly factor BamD (BamD/ComL family)
MVFVRIDAEKDSALARQFGVAFYPTIVVTRPDGSEIDRLVEYYPPTEFYNEVQLYLIGKETLEDYLTRLEDEPERVEYHLIVAQKYRNRSNWDKALEYYNNVVKLSADDQQDEVEEAMFETTGILAEKENYKTSITACRDFIKRFPDSERLEDVQRRIPYYMAQNGELSKAIKLFEKYLDDYPQGEYVDWVKQRISELNEAIKEK